MNKYNDRQMTPVHLLIRFRLKEVIKFLASHNTIANAHQLIQSPIKAKGMKEAMDSAAIFSPKTVVRNSAELINFKKP